MSMKHLLTCSDFSVWGLICGHQGSLFLVSGKGGMVQKLQYQNPEPQIRGLGLRVERLAKTDQQTPRLILSMKSVNILSTFDDTTAIIMGRSFHGHNPLHTEFPPQKIVYEIEIQGLGFGF